MLPPRTTVDSRLPPSKIYIFCDENRFLRTKPYIANKGGVFRNNCRSNFGGNNIASPNQNVCCRHKMTFPAIEQEQCFPPSKHSSFWRTKLFLVRTKPFPAMITGVKKYTVQVPFCRKKRKKKKRGFREQMNKLKSSPPAQPFCRKQNVSHPRKSRRGALSALTMRAASEPGLALGSFSRRFL